VEAAVAPTVTTDTQSTQIWLFRGELVGQLPLARFVPFVALGVGRMGVFSNALGNDADPLIDWGVGAKFAISRAVSARFDLRDNLTQKSQATDGTLTHHLEMTFGLTLRIPVFSRADNQAGPGTSSSMHRGAEPPTPISLF
jgi:hypothetical protein